MQATEDFQQEVLNRLKCLDQDIKGLGDRIDKSEIRFDLLDAKFGTYIKASDRLLGVATTIIITAGAVTILSPFVQTTAPAIRAMLGRST